MTVAPLTALHNGRRAEVVRPVGGGWLLREQDKFWPGVWIAPAEEVRFDFVSVSFAPPRGRRP